MEIFTFEKGHQMLGCDPYFSIRVEHEEGKVTGRRAVIYKVVFRVAVVS